MKEIEEPNQILEHKHRRRRRLIAVVWPLSIVLTAWLSFAGGVQFGIEGGNAGTTLGYLIFPEDRYPPSGAKIHCSRRVTAECAASASQEIGKRIAWLENSEGFSSYGLYTLDGYAVQTGGVERASKVVVRSGEKDQKKERGRETLKGPGGEDIRLDQHDHGFDMYWSTAGVEYSISASYFRIDRDPKDIARDLVARLRYSP